MPRKKMSDEVADRLRQDILSKVYPEGTFLPTDARMTEIYNVSRMTMRGIIATLEAEGLVHRARGKGVQVRKHLIQRSTEIQSFTDLMTRRGMKAGSTMYKFDKRLPSDEAVEQLRITADTSVYYILRLRLGNDAPMALEESYIPAARFPNLEMFNIRDYSLYDIFFNHYKLEVSWAQDIITAVTLTKDEADKLTAGKLGFGLEIINTLYDVDNVPVEFTRSIYVPERFSYTVTSSRAVTTTAVSAGPE